MNETPYLICELRGLRYALDAGVVREMFALPALRPVAEMPPYIVGALNVRGAVVPVLDLDIRSGRASAPYRAGDVVVVLGLSNTLLGLIVSDVADVVELAADALEPVPPLGNGLDPQPRFIRRLAKLDADILLVLDHERLLAESDAVAASIEGALLPETPATGANGSGRIAGGSAPVAIAADAAVFAERARRLVAAAKGRDTRAAMPVAAFVIGGEYYGVDLDLIQEFSEIQTVTPLPCCPPQIVGQVNLRGDVVTLVDIAPTLNLPRAEGARAKMMVVRMDSLRMGISVDDVSDVVHVHADEIAEVPSALRPAGREYLKGAVPYAGKMLGLLDLRSLVADGGLTVREDV